MQAKLSPSWFDKNKNKNSSFRTYVKGKWNPIYILVKKIWITIITSVDKCNH